VVECHLRWIASSNAECIVYACMHVFMCACVHACTCARVHPVCVSTFRSFAHAWTMMLGRNLAFLHRCFLSAKTMQICQTNILMCVQVEPVTTKRLVTTQMYLNIGKGTFLGRCRWTTRRREHQCHHRQPPAFLPVSVDNYIYMADNYLCRHKWSAGPRPQCSVGEHCSRMVRQTCMHRCAQRSRHQQSG